jgi:hypothetical protein
MDRRFRLVAIFVATGILAAAAVRVFWRKEQAICPTGTRPDQDRQARVANQLRVGLARLSDRADAQQLARAWREGEAWCFGQRSEVQEGGPLFLDATVDDGETAARAGHLLLHRLVAAPWPRMPDLPCDQRVRQALAAEGRALALELELRRVLGVTRARISYAVAADSEGVFGAAAIEAVLASHPEGAPGVPALGQAYAQRCRQEARKR